MKIRICSDFDDVAGTCSVPLEWVDAQELIGAVQQQPWLSLEDGVRVALAIGAVWATAWAIRAIAQQLWSYIR